MEERSIDVILKRPYARILIPDEDGGYSAEVLEFPGCFSEGDTADEAIQALERAAASWIENALVLGQAIPDPLPRSWRHAARAHRLHPLE